MDTASYEDFARIQMLTARVISAEPIAGKTRIMRATVDVGEPEPRQVIIGGAEHFGPEEMVGRDVIVVANLAPRTVSGVESQAMLLAADVDGRPHWLSAGPDVRPGSPVM